MTQLTGSGPARKRCYVRHGRIVGTGEYEDREQWMHYGPEYPSVYLGTARVEIGKWQIHDGFSSDCATCQEEGGKGFFHYPSMLGTAVGATTFLGLAGVSLAILNVLGVM